MASTPMDMEQSHKEMEKKRKAMQGRLSKLGTDNPVVKQALKDSNPKHNENKWQNWQIVDSLVSAARKEYMEEEDKDMMSCVGNLAKALTKLASSKSSPKSDEDY